MGHWRAMFDNKYVGAWDLPKGKDCVCVIERVEAGLLDVPASSEKKRKPVVFLVGKQKPFVLNKTNAKAIAAMYGHDTAEWTGQPIALYVAQTSSPEGIVDCIRVRPTPPPMPRNESPTPPSAGGVS